MFGPPMLTLNLCIGFSHPAFLSWTVSPSTHRRKRLGLRKGSPCLNRLVGRIIPSDSPLIKTKYVANDLQLIKHEAHLSSKPILLIVSYKYSYSILSLALIMSNFRVELPVFPFL